MLKKRIYQICWHGSPYTLNPDTTLCHQKINILKDNHTGKVLTTGSDQSFISLYKEMSLHADILPSSSTHDRPEFILLCV